MILSNRNVLWNNDAGVEIEPAVGVVYYQLKGDGGDSYYKTFLWTEDGYYCEGIGNTLVESLADVMEWASYLSGK
jgi:hypothetical protein